MLEEIDASEPATDIVETITADLFGCIEDALHDICVNAIDERERYAEDSTQMRALWLDNVINSTEDALYKTRKAIDNLRAKMR